MSRTFVLPGDRALALVIALACSACDAKKSSTPDQPALGASAATGGASAVTSPGSGNTTGSGGTAAANTGSGGRTGTGGATATSGGTGGAEPIDAGGHDSVADGSTAPVDAGPP